MFHVNYIVGLAEYMTGDEIRQVIEALSRKIGVDVGSLDLAEREALWDGYNPNQTQPTFRFPRYIEVIKMYRARTGCDLLEAKQTVEKFVAENECERPDYVAPKPRRFKIVFDEQDKYLNAEEIAELKKYYTGHATFLSQKIQVIKMFRERTGQGLKESKEAVDRYIERCTVEDK